jgi:hypothetical protein
MVLDVFFVEQLTIADIKTKRTSQRALRTGIDTLETSDALRRKNPQAAGNEIEERARLPVRSVRETASGWRGCSHLPGLSHQI